MGGSGRGGEGEERRLSHSLSPDSFKMPKLGGKERGKIFLKELLGSPPREKRGLCGVGRREEDFI